MRNSISTLFVLTALLLCEPGRAATVTSTADDGPGSLREAIANAAGAETIDFSVSGVITLTSGELVIAKDLTILGPGSDTLAIQRSLEPGTEDFRILNIQFGVVTISGLTLSNGRSGYGGGILSEADAIVLMHDVTLSGNSASSAGGGLFNSGTMALEDSAFIDNTVQTIDGSGAYGGGLDNWSTILWMDRCRFDGNSASAGSGDGGGFGGAINNSGTISLMDACALQGNWATGGTGSGNGFGGGINNEFGTLTLTNCTLTSNSALGGTGNGAGFGGGINNEFGTVYLDVSTVRGNIARGGSGTEGGLAEGGGIANAFGTVELDRSTVSANLVVGGDGASGGSGEGGGVANDYGTVYLYNSTVSGNVSGTGGPGVHDGGGLFNGFGSLVLSHSTVSANAVPGGFPNDGGGLFNLGGGVEIKNTIVAANDATVDWFNDEFAETYSYGFNRIGSTAGLFSAGPDDQFDLTAAALKLGPLQDNGGPTFTHALLCGSPAINAGDDTDAPDTDQRGFARIVGGSIDIGAYEADNGGGVAPPTVECPVVPSAGADGNCEAVTPNLLSAVKVIDGCGEITLSQSPEAGTLVGLGPHTITVMATDAAGNSATCTTTFMVTDNTAPTVNCSAVAGASADGNCQAAVPNVMSGVTVSDGCTAAGSITVSQSPAAGTLVGLGTHAITVTATDAAGNSATCTTSFTVTDDTAPMLICPTVPDGYCQAAVPNVLGGVTVSDGCTVAGAITLSQSPVAGTVVGVGTHLITVTATDAAGNSTTCITTFTVTDGATLAAGSCSLGQAGSYAVFIMENVPGTKSTISSAGTKVTGNVAIGPSASGASSDLLKATITGTLTLDPGAVVTIHDDLTVNGGLVSQDLTVARNDALAASACFAALAPTQTYSTINNSTTISGNGGLNVINVGSVVLVKKVLTLSGGPNDVFIFNVSGDYSLGSSQIKLTGGVKASNVLWNFPGTGTTVNVYKDVTSAVGTFLVPFRDYVQDVAALTGSVIAGGNVRIHSGATVTRPAGCTP